MTSSPEPRSGTFSAETARSALNVVCAELAIACDDAELIRLGQNALYRLHSQPYVVRIGRGLSYLDDAKKELAVSEWLAEQQFPAVRPAELDRLQPLIANEHPITVWRYIDGRTATRDDVDVLGRVLRRFHSLPAPRDYRLPELDALKQVAPRVEKATVPDSDKRFLLELCADLRERWSTLEFVLPSCVIHGDAHVQNLMMVDGSPVMLDFERVVWGPPEWDLAKTATEYQTAGLWTEQEYARFVEAYGFDVTTWSGFPVLRATEALAMVSWLMQNVSHGEDIAAEYRARLDTLRGHGNGEWRPF